MILYEDNLAPLPICLSQISIAGLLFRTQNFGTLVLLTVRIFYPTGKFPPSGALFGGNAVPSLPQRLSNLAAGSLSTASWTCQDWRTAVPGPATAPGDRKRP